MVRFLIFLLVAVGFVMPAHTERRIALLVGNANYAASIGALDNPDWQDLYSVLT